MKRLVWPEPVEVIVDDLTGEEIAAGRGWVLHGIDKDPHREYHFKSLSGLLVALATKGTAFGLSDDESLLRLADRFQGVGIFVGLEES